jgi:hypothetical protein
MTPPAIIQEAAAATSNPTLMLAISYVESRWKHDALGKAGEIGAVQLHPRYHVVPKTTKAQFKYADEYLAKLKKQCGELLFLACYNAGPKKALDKGIGMVYTQKVTEVYRALLKDQKNRRSLTPHQSKVRITAND